MERQLKTEFLSHFLENVKLSRKLNKMQYQRAQHLYDSGLCSLLSSSENTHSYLVHDHHQNAKTTLVFTNKRLEHDCSCGASQLCSHVYASALQAYQDLSSMASIATPKHLKYSAEGMKKRVLQERAERAFAEDFHLHFADNKYGEHLIENAKGMTYQLSFYDFKNQQGYCSCPDYQTNKLSTCKHLIYAFKSFKVEFPEHHMQQQNYPFVEIYCNPQKNYHISWFYPHALPEQITSILQHYFDKEAVFKVNMLSRLHIFLDEISQYKLVKIREEVHQYANLYYQEQSIAHIASKLNPDLPQVLKHNLLSFQEEGTAWAIGKRACIMADEIGLGKSAQALGAAIHKLRCFDMNSICIVCPEAILPYWATEIEKWVPNVYHSSISLCSLNNSTSFPSQTDVLIIDEAQKINDYSLSILTQLKAIEYQQMLLITDSKLENSLIKFYTMVGLFDKHLMNPLWEISYQHCLFDAQDPQKIVGYYQTEKLLKRLEHIYLRRERKALIDQLPKADLLIVPVALQNNVMHRYTSTAKKAIHLLQARYKSAYDISQLRNLFQNLLALSKYNFIQDTKVQDNPKIQEFIHFVQHKIHLNQHEKVVVFADKFNLQHQLVRSLNQIQLSATLSKEDFAQEDANYKYLVTTENLQDIPPQVQHYIYFHLPQEADHIKARQNKIVVDSESIQQARIYLLQSRQSMEEMLHQWSNTKPHYLKQFLGFIHNKDYSHYLESTLESFLCDKLKLQLNRSQGQDKQMSLFSQKITPKQSATTTSVTTKNNFWTFNEKMIQAFKQFETLDSASKTQLLSSDYTIEETEDAWRIILKKR